MAKGEGGGGAKGCFKWGCIGCAGVLVLGVLLMAIFSGVAWQKVQSQEVKEETLTPELPVAPRAAADPDAPGDDTAPSGEVEMRTEALEPGRPAAGRVVLDLRNGGFFFYAADAGEPLRVEASYDANTYQLVEKLEDGEDGIWTYRVSFRRTSGMMMAVLAQMFGGEEPVVRIFLPPDIPLDLDVTLREGASDLDLGGLWLTSADIDFARGGFNLQVSEPMKEPMDSFTLQGSMGGFNAEDIGNASPRKLDVNVRMGGMNLDLRGEWMQDADVNLEWDMGGGNVVLPRNVAIQGVEGHDYAGPDGEVPVPTLHFQLNGKPDDMKFETPRRR